MSGFSTAANPRLGQGQAALTSLGAVGGPTGTAAGALRVLVEFLTQYDGAAAKQLASDLEKLNDQDANLTREQEQRQTRLAQVTEKLQKTAAAVQAHGTQDQKKDLREIQALQVQGTRTSISQAKILSKELATNLRASGFITKSEASDLSRRTQLLQEQVALEARIAGIKAEQKILGQQITQTTQQTVFQEKLRAGLAPKLTGLAIGAIGGLVGGTILGAGFAVVQAALSSVGDILEDMLDPSKKASENIQAIGEAIDSISKSESISRLEAINKLLGNLANILTDDQKAALAAAAADAKLTDEIKNQKLAVDALKDPEAQRRKNIEDIKNLLIQTAEASGTARKTFQEIFTTVGVGRTEVTDQLYYLIEATRLYDESLKDESAQLAATIGAEQAAAASKRALADATAFATEAQRQFNSALQSAGERQLAPLQAQLEGIESTPSGRTKRLQAQIEALQNAGSRGGGSRNNFAEERALILLRQRLKLMGDNINLEKYSGKFLLEAINAKIAALGKEASAQDRVNKLLDLQFKESQQLRRNQGESVGDFLERRAQNNRQLLSERRGLERESRIQELNELRDKVQDQVALQNLAEQQRNSAVKSGSDKRLQLLQKELQASQKADADAAKKKRALLQREIDDKRKAVDEAIELASDQAREEFLAAVRGADNLQDINRIKGRLAGLIRAKATIEGMIAGFGIPAAIAAPFLSNINAQINALQSKENRFIHKGARAEDYKRFASGGIIPLNNASTLFGSDVRFGEQGEEWAVIFSNKMKQAMQGRQMPTVHASFYGSQNPYGDRYHLKQIIKEVMREELH